MPGPVPLTKTLTSLSATVFHNERQIVTTSRLTDTVKIKCNVVGGHSLIRWRSYYTVTILYALLSYLLVVCFVCFCLFCYRRPVKQRMTTTALLGTGRCNSAFKKKRHGTEREELTLCGGGRQNPSPGQPPQKAWVGAVDVVPDGCRRVCTECSRGKIPLRVSALSAFYLLHTLQRCVQLLFCLEASRLQLLTY